MHVPKEEKVKLKNKNFRHSKSECPKLNNRGEIFITEEGLYNLISGSKMKAAKKFKKWVFGEVLPSIRKTGKYDMDDLLKSEYYSTIKQLPGFAEDIKFKTDTIEKVSDVAQMKHQLKSKVWRDFISLFNEVYHVNLNLKITNFMKKNNIKKRPTTREYLDHANLHRQACIVFEMLRHDKRFKMDPERLATMKAMCEVYYSHLTEEEKTAVDDLVFAMFKSKCFEALPNDHFVKNKYETEGNLIKVDFG